MKSVFPDRFFVTGTDTGVGKTMVCALLAAGLRHNYWKPVQSGSMDGLDSDVVRELAGLEQDRIIPESYVFSRPLSPHLAAQKEGARIDPDLIQLPANPGSLIIEGAGGVLVPLNKDFLMIDLIKKLAVPPLIVASNRLGVINHTLLTVTALKQAGIDILGVILNGAVNNEHKQAIEHYGNVSVLAQLERLDNITRKKVKQKFNELFL
ncbi:MAG: dethiobiotin synthase [Desulfonatronovibrio sp.]